jgi:class 3 adenylate cyclase
MTDLLTGTVTFLFTDIEGSTELLKRLGKRYGKVLTDHREILRKAVRQHGGEEVDRQGDSFLFAFPRADEAAAAAIDSQHGLAAHEWPPGNRLRVRMGIHTAEPTVSEEGYYGLGVHRAARIMAAAHGGQVLVSLATSSVLEDAELQGATLRDLGEHWLKDLDRPERIFQLDLMGLKSAFPPPRAAKGPKPRTEPATGEAADELLERSDALSTLADSLTAIAGTARGQLVLVSGEAGVGKTARVASRSGTSSPAALSKSLSRQTDGYCCIERPSMRWRTRRPARPISSGSRTTPTPPATARLSFASPPQQRYARPPLARTVRLPHSTRGRSNTLRASGCRSGRSCSSAAPTSAI